MLTPLEGPAAGQQQRQQDKSGEIAYFPNDWSRLNAEDAEFLKKASYPPRLQPRHSSEYLAGISNRG